MDLTISEELRLLRDEVDRLVAGTRSRGAQTGPPTDLVALGWHSILIPEANGGMGCSMLEVATCVHGLGRMGSSAPFLGSMVEAPTLVASLISPRRAALLAGIGSGEHRFAGVLEGDATANAVHASEEGGSFVLQGKAGLVVDTMPEYLLAVPAMLGSDERIVVVVPLSTPGLLLHPLALADGRDAAHVRLDRVRVDGAAILRGDVVEALAEARDRGRVALCAHATGTMADMIEVTREHLRTRKQFGVPIKSFQVLRHRFVDMVLAYEQAEAITLVAALACDAPAVERQRLCQIAKATIGSATRIVGEAAVQMQGGMGLTEEHLIGRHYKRLLVDSVLLGTREEILRARVEEGLIDRRVAPELMF